MKYQIFKQSQPVLKSFQFLETKKPDILLVFFLSFFFGILTYYNSLKIPVSLYDFYAQDVWFSSDIPTVFGNLISFSSDFGRNNKHPLFVLFANPPVLILTKLFSISPIEAVRFVFAFFVGIWSALLFTLFRTLRLRQLDSILLCILASVSASALFWMGVPESFLLGSISIVLVLLFAAVLQYRQFSMPWHVALCAASLSITITNWMFGLFTAIIYNKRLQALKVVVSAFFVVTVLWFLQRAFYKNAGFPFQLQTFLGEKKFSSQPDFHTIITTIISIITKTIVVPSIHFQKFLERPDWVTPNFDNITSGIQSIWFSLATISWYLLLFLAIWCFITHKNFIKFKIVLGLGIVLQLVLHSFYGSEIAFLYTLHFLPLFLALVSFIFLTKWRIVGIILTGVLIISAGINNYTVFNKVTTELAGYGTPRQQLDNKIKNRPLDHWPRGSGHVILAKAGSNVNEKSYLEPGGSFSPSAGSFGVSIWVKDTLGKILTTSDEIPLNNIKQQFVYEPSGDVRGINTQTEFYSAFWKLEKPGLWKLFFKSNSDYTGEINLLFRSAGPAGGKISSLNWDGKQLLINNHWVVSSSSPISQPVLGSEDSTDWINKKESQSNWADSNGWGFARFSFNGNSVDTITLIDQLSNVSSSALANDSGNNLTVLLPDTHFAQCLNAQIAHLRMGIAGLRLYPGDPIASHLPRMQEGSYELVALCRAGYTQIVEQLSPYFMESDFTNGFLPTAQIPALGILTLTECASLINKQSYYELIWPHIKRKVQIIASMHSGPRSGYPVAVLAQKPFVEDQEFSSASFRSGDMEYTPGLINSNLATSKLNWWAIKRAVEFANTLNKKSEVELWLKTIHVIEIALIKNYKNDSTVDPQDNTFWPSAFFVESASKLINLNDYYVTNKNKSINTSSSCNEIDLFKAHQFLFKGNVDKVWDILKIYWQNQSSQGLYCWSNELKKENNITSFQNLSQWYKYYSLTPLNSVSPSYYTAAAMLLLQLDMLAYVKVMDSVPVLVIGAGVPKKWLSSPIMVNNLMVNKFLVSWTYDGNKVLVDIIGDSVNVELGSFFPKNVELVLRYNSYNKNSQIVTKNLPHYKNSLN